MFKINRITFRQECSYMCGQQKSKTNSTLG